MDTKIKKWGNSLALRIPKSFAEETNLKDGVSVELTIEDNKLVVRPKKSHHYELKKLLGQVNEQNTHEEYSFGVKTGDEEW